MNEIAKVSQDVVSGSKLGRGYEEGIDRSDLIMPRATLLQKMSPEIEENPQKFKAGTIIDNINQEPLPEVFIPIFKYTEWRKFNPRDTSKSGYDPAYQPGELIWMTKDPNDPRVKEAEFGPNGEKPTAIKFLNFLSLFEGQEIPVVISFKMTSMKAGKRLLSLCAFKSLSQKCDMFAYKYKLGVKEEQSVNGKYFVYTINNAGKVTDSELTEVEALYNEFKPKVKDIQTDEVWDE